MIVHLFEQDYLNCETASKVQFQKRIPNRQIYIFDHVGLIVIFNNYNMKCKKMKI